MGMGHYERLLLSALAEVDVDQQCVFDFVFAGRRNGEISQWECPIPQLQGGKMLGVGTGRLSGLPWAAARGAVSLLERSSPDLYHSLALTFPAPGRRPAIYTIHDLPPARFDDEGSVPRWAKQAVRDAAAVHVPSEFAQRELIELLDLPEHKVRVIRYGCELDVFNTDVKPAAPEQLESFGLRPPFMLYVGGFTRRKNVRALLQAWREVARYYPDVQLGLVGPETQLRSLASEVNLPQVRVVGYLGRNTLPSALKASEGLVFPSIYEGFGLPPLESLAMGVPVVAVRAGAVPEVVQDAAVLAEEGSAEAVAEAVKRLLGDVELRESLRKRGPERANDFDWGDHGRAMLKLYEEVIAG